jgi:hypothetical protein
MTHNLLGLSVTISIMTHILMRHNILGLIVIFSITLGIMTHSLMT